MPKFKEKKMCNECPFRKKSIKGWLGPHTAEEMQTMAHSGQGFTCHKEVNAMSKDGYDDEEIAHDGQHCVGMIRYRNKICKTSRNEEERSYQNSLKHIDDEPVLDAFTFVDHHGSI
jgi:hypothetical protein